MNLLFHIIRIMDVTTYQWLTQFAGNWFLDRLVSSMDSYNLFKGGFFLSIYCYFWFVHGPAQEVRRKAMVTIMTGTLLGLFVARTVALLAPFRVRPMYDSELVHHALSIPVPSNYVDWSAFASDHATYFSALAFGLIWLSRRLTVPIVLYTLVWIWLPRMYLGLHYASDMLVGAGIGVAAVWLSLRTELLRSGFPSRILQLMEANPGAWYCAGFLVMYEMAQLFWDIRGPVHQVWHAASVGPYRRIIRIICEMLFAGGTLVAGTTVFLKWYRSRFRQRGIFGAAEKS